MSKKELKEKWCPECIKHSPEKHFTAFRCKHCCEEKGKPSKLPKFLLDYYKELRK